MRGTIRAPHVHGRKNSASTSVPKKYPAAAAPRHRERGNLLLILRLVPQCALVAVVQEFRELLAQHLVAFAAMADEYRALE